MNRSVPFLVKTSWGFSWTTKITSPACVSGCIRLKLPIGRLLRKESRDVHDKNLFPKALPLFFVSSIIFFPYRFCISCFLQQFSLILGKHHKLFVLVDTFQVPFDTFEQHVPFLYIVCKFGHQHHLFHYKFSKVLFFRVEFWGVTRYSIVIK